MFTPNLDFSCTSFPFSFGTFVSARLVRDPLSEVTVQLLYLQSLVSQKTSFVLDSPLNLLLLLSLRCFSSTVRDLRRFVKVVRHFLIPLNPFTQIFSSNKCLFIFVSFYFWVSSENYRYILVNEVFDFCLFNLLYVSLVVQCYCENFSFPTLLDTS